MFRVFNLDSRIMYINYQMIKKSRVSYTPLPIPTGIYSFTENKGCLVVDSFLQGKAIFQIRMAYDS